MFPRQENPLGWVPKGTGPMAIRVRCKKNQKKLPRVVTQL